MVAGTIVVVRFGQFPPGETVITRAAALNVR